MSQRMPHLWFCGVHLCMCEVVLSWTIFEDIAVSINPCSQVSVHFMSVSIWQWRWLPCLNIILLYCVLAKLKVQHFLLIHHSVWAKSDRCLILSCPLHIPRLGSKNPHEKWKFANTWLPPLPQTVFYYFYKCFPFLCGNIMMESCALFLFTPTPSPPASWTWWGMAWRLVQVLGQFWCSRPLKVSCIFILGATLHICETMKYEPQRARVAILLPDAPDKCSYLSLCVIQQEWQVAICTVIWRTCESDWLALN